MFSSICDWLCKVALISILSSFAFNLVDLVGVEETEILPDVACFVVAICSGAYTTFSARTTSSSALCHLTFR